MKKRFFMAVMLVMSLCGIVKADAVQTLTINGQKVEKVVSQLTFSGDNVVLHFDGSEESYPMNEVQIDFTVTNGLNIAGLADGTPVAVYDISGKKVAGVRAAGKVTQLSVDGLNGGVYILKAGNQIVKFVKR